MSGFKQKNVLKRHKIRLQEKFNTVSEETVHTISSLNNCVSEFKNRVDQILEIKDDKYLASYRKLIKDFEHFRDKLIVIQSCLDEDSDEDSDSQNEVSESRSLTDTGDPELKSTVQHYGSSECSSSKNIIKNEISVQIKSEDFDEYESIIDDFGSLPSSTVFTQDNGFSSDIVNTKENINNSEIVQDKFQSLQAFSQSSCYQSFSSSISEALPLDVKQIPSHSQNVNDNLQSDVESQSRTIIHSLVINIPSTVSATLAYIVNPGDFWIQIESSCGSQISYSKLKYHDQSCPSTIKQFDYCLAPFKSSPFYYRARSLQDAQHGSDVLSVHFIDHGSTQEVMLEDLRYMPFSAYSFPAQAIRCHLLGIVPVDEYWSEKCIERFREFQSFNIEAIIKKKSKENSYGVQLIAKSPEYLNEDFSADIASSLYLEGLALQENEQPRNMYPSLASSNLCRASPPLKSSDCDIAVSNDSGVSLTSAYKSSQPSNDKNENLCENSDVCTTVDSISLPTDTCDSKNVNSDLHTTNLISFESFNSIPDQNSVLTPPDISESLLFKDANYSLHLKIPPPTLVFVEKDMMLVMLSYIVSPHEFYVNMAMETIGNLDELREQMTTTYESQSQCVPQVHIEDLSENMFCAGYYDVDAHWYRVKIIRINSQDRKDGKVLVQYVDYGNCAMIKCSNLLPLAPDFAQHPIFALKCSLAGILPIVDSPLFGLHSSEWNENAINKFKLLTNNDQCLTAQICPELCHSSDAYPVLLWDTEEDSDLLINLALADLGVAYFDNQVLLRTAASKPLLRMCTNVVSKSSNEIDDLNKWDPMSEEYNDIKNSYGVDNEDIAGGYCGKDDEYVCKYYSLRGHCPRTNCRYLHVPLLENGVTRDQEEVYCLDNSFFLPGNAKTFLVQVTAIVNPSQFYVFLPFGCKSVNEIDKLVKKGKTYEEIINHEAEVLFHALNHHYSNTPFQENTTIDLALGTIVVAKRRWDQQFHRGRVVDISATSESFKIFFVDFGDVELVPRKLIRTILPQFLYTPFQAVQCSLSRVKPIGSDDSKWSWDALMFFKNAVEGQMLLAEVAERCNQVLYVSLRRTNQDNHKKLTDLLVAEGFAAFCSEVPAAIEKCLYVPG